ncbi:hypothetical protein CTAYLR_002719 [Chrysophaeum taylorii]|uniref:Uncharacterized protein n=1 Tax=Chrysophaeum taylorii TaxID=2483200 RepID=A0AAD7UEB1_9STRA|nr:hypothetical protein CTAYLR_002719 [Chrysophaeum taylorii]
MYVVPLGCILSGLVLAVPYSICTRFSYWAAFKYLLSNMAGLSTPLTGKMPARHGHFVTVVVSTIGFVIVAINTGIITNLQLTKRFIEYENSKTDRSSIRGALRSTAMTVAVACALIIVYIGMSSVYLAMCEQGHMDIKQSFLYTFSNAVGLCDAITDKTPQTTHGRAFAVVGSLSNLGVVGAVIGLVGELNVFNDILVSCGLLPPDDDNEKDGSYEAAETKIDVVESTG